MQKNAKGSAPHPYYEQDYSAKMWLLTAVILNLIIQFVFFLGLQISEPPYHGQSFSVKIFLEVADGASADEFVFIMMWVCLFTVWIGVGELVHHFWPSIEKNNFFLVMCFLLGFSAMFGFYFYGVPIIFGTASPYIPCMLGSFKICNVNTNLLMSDAVSRMSKLITTFGVSDITANLISKIMYWATLIATIDGCISFFKRLTKKHKVES